MLLRFGIVGCGHIALKHRDAIYALPNAKLVAACDTDPLQLKKFVVGDERVSLCRDYRQLLLTDLDVICICTPSGLHAEIAIAAAYAGKHVIVEKPMALSVADTEAMIAACRVNRVKLAVVHPNRFREAFQELKRRVSEGAFGKIFYAKSTLLWHRARSYYTESSWRGTRTLDGGVLLNQAVHIIDLLLWLVGDVEEVRSCSSNSVHNQECEDTAISILKFCNGALGTIEASVAVYPQNLEESLSIFGERGTAVIGGTTASLVKYWRFSDMTEQESSLFIANINRRSTSDASIKSVIHDMILAIVDDREPEVSGKEGQKAITLIAESLKTAEEAAWGSGRTNLFDRSASRV